MQTCLSVDLDYWGFNPYDKLHVREPLYDVMDFFIRLTAYKHKTFKFIVNHEDILGFLHHGEWDIYNVDYHDDYAGDRYLDVEYPLNLNCGTWVSFVEKPEDSAYTWLFPEKECPDFNGYGRCHHEIDVWDIKYQTFKSQKKRLKFNGAIFKPYDLVCVVASPEWCKEIDPFETIRLITSMVKKR